MGNTEIKAEAKWIKVKELKSGFIAYKCSSCSKGDTFSPHTVGTNFCPHCGKRMANSTT